MFSLDDPGLRAEICALMAKDPGEEAARAAALADWLQGLPAGVSVGLYGCGAVAARLARGHKEALEGRRLAFFTTQANGEALFHGFPRTSLDQILKSPPDRIALLSATYEHSMRLNLKALDPKGIVGLEDIVRTRVSRESLSACLERALDQGKRLARDLSGLPCLGGKSICVQMMNFGSVYRLSAFKKVREAGYGLVLATTRAACLPMPAEDMVSAGYVDYVYVASSDEALEFALLHLLGEHDLFTLFEFPKHFKNVWYVSKVAETARARTIAYADNFLSSFFEDPGHAEQFSANLGLDQDCLRRCYARFFRNVDAVIYKDSDKALDRFCAMFGAWPQRLFHLPYIDGGCLARPPAEKHSARDGIRRIAFAHSLHQGFFFREWFDCRELLRLIEAVTATGLGFTVFNSMDRTGSGWEEFMDLARENPLFEYRTHLPYDRFLPELARYDYGWLGYRFRGRVSEFVRTNLQLKIFAYAQAGLPTLVSPEFEHSHGLVLEKGIGLSVESHDWPRLADLLKDYDLDRCLANIRALCAELSVQAHAKDMIEFYDRLSAGGGGG
ncbi:MAG: hypothetical protein PHV85_09930 [Desulfovibrionaceae bacterium]|nr:hypothetical protein [Desulfovibrionaceae bacterium]